MFESALQGITEILSSPEVMNASISLLFISLFVLVAVILATFTDKASDDKVQTYELLKNFALDVVVKMAHITDAEEEEALRRAELYPELADDDPRLIMVATELERFAKENTGLRINILQAKAIAESVYQRWMSDAAE